MSDETVYYRADVPGLKRGDPATRTLDVIDEEEYTYATTRLDVARGIAARNTGYLVYRVLLNEPIEADPGAARDGVGIGSSGLRRARWCMSRMRKQPDGLSQSLSGNQSRCCIACFVV